MKPAAIRRFSIAEIILHWANAVLYIALFITGSVILLKHIFDLEIGSHETLSLIHRIAGISLISVLALTIILSISVKGFKKSWISLRQFLSWKLSDIVWLIKVPLNMMYKHVVLPPADRFNPGQKLHVIAVFIVLTGISVSGIIMIEAPGTLLAWVVHLACFILAALFLLLHMFLSLINPSTRKSLSAIFTGFVSHEYASKHHPKWVENKDSLPHESYVSWKAAAVTAIALTGIISLLIYNYGPKQAKDKIQKLISNRGTSAIFPGPLTKSHADDPELKNCTACHRSFLTPSPAACLSCHKIIARRMADKSGYHGTLSNQCNDCHRDHLGSDADIRNFDTTKFDHALANFMLKGKHEKMPCKKCHLVKVTDSETVRIKYIGLSFEKCTDCHKDPHKGKFKQACTVCHSEDGWKKPNLIFSHKKDSQFKIAHPHLQIACDACHKDPHLGRFDKSCDKCHSENGWKGADLLFSHNKDSKFKIDRIHSHLECTSCHKGNEAVLFKPLPTTCKKCHVNIEKLSQGIARRITAKPDPHAGRVACSKCHQKNKQKPSEYADKCKSCHNEKYEQLYYDWKKVFDRRALQAEKSILKLNDEDEIRSDQLSEKIKEANETGFHNIDLANELWDQCCPETPVSNKQ